MSYTFRTIVLPLTVTNQQHEKLQTTFNEYAHVRHQAAQTAWNNTPKQPADIITSKKTLENKHYQQHKNTTDLHANLVQKAYKDVAQATTTIKTQWKKGNRVSKPEFTRDSNTNWAMTIDTKAGTFHKHKVRISTNDGLEYLSYQTPAQLDGSLYEKYVLDNSWNPTTSKLVYDGDGQYHFHLTVKKQASDSHWTARETFSQVSNTLEQDTTRVLGVDLNVNNYTAVTSAGGFYGNADYFNHQKSYFEAKRGQFQQAGTNAAHSRMNTTFKQRENGFYHEYEHHVANGIVRDALRVQATHVVFEDLENIRDRMSNLPKYQQWMFKSVQQLVEYKLEAYGVNVVDVEPEYTSQSCSMVGCESCCRENRSGKSFECVECGLVLNADYNAARNIGLKYLGEVAVPANQTCSSGKATSQLALMSGVITKNGEFLPKPFKTLTDKPTPSGVA